MDHAPTQTLKLCAILTALWVGPIPAQVRDPADTLVAARDRALEGAEHLTNVSCIQTVDHSYFSRENPSEEMPTCEQIDNDRKKGKYKLRLYATARMRLKVFRVNGHEVYAWTDPLNFESYDVREVLARRPVNTGAFGGYYIGLFESPEARFQYLGERSGKLAYGFRESLESSDYVIKSGSRWVPTAHDGSFLIDPASLDLEQFTDETSALGRQTLMCDARSTVDYHKVQIAGEDILLPQRTEFRHILDNTEETLSEATYSSCAAEPPPTKAPAMAESILPQNLPVVLTFDDPIDTDIAAAGDQIRATVSKPVLEKGSFKILMQQGTRGRGRILNMEHVLYKPDPTKGRLIPQYFFAIAISFEVAEINGVVSPLHLRLDKDATLRSGETVITKNSRWPERSLLFETRDERQNRHVVPRGFESKWLTTK